MNKQKRKIYILEILFLLFIPILLLLGNDITINNYEENNKSTMDFEHIFIAAVPNFTRTDYPVILSNETNEDIWLILDEHHVDNIRIAYYSMENQWELVPFQIDEIGYVRRFKYESGSQVDTGALGWSLNAVDLTSWGRYYAAHTYLGRDIDAQSGDPYEELTKYECEDAFWASRLAEGWDTTDPSDPNPPGPVNSTPTFDPREADGGIWEQIEYRIDYDDELVFNAQNGQQVPTSNWWNSSFSEDRIELHLVDSVDGGESWMYIYYNDLDLDNENPAPTTYFIPEGGEDSVNWNSSNLTITGETYQIEFDPNNVDLMRSVIVDLDGSSPLNISSEIGKQWSAFNIYMDLTSSGINVFTVEKSLDQVREGTWGAMNYDEQTTAFGYGITMDLDLMNLPLEDPDWATNFPGQDTNYENGHRYDALMSSYSHAGIQDEYHAYFGQPAAYDDGADHDGTTSDDAPFVRGLLDFSGASNESAIDGPCRVILQRTRLISYGVPYETLVSTDRLGYEEAWMITYDNLIYYANMAESVVQPIEITETTIEGFTAEFHVHYTFITGQRFSEDYRSDTSAEIIIGRAPNGEAGLPDLDQCDDEGLSWPLYLYPNGDDSDDNYTTDSGPIADHFDNTPLVSGSDEGNAVGDWSLCNSSSGGIWNFIPYQAAWQMFEDGGGNGYGDFAMYWNDNGDFTEMAAYGNDGKVNGEMGELTGRTVFGALTEWECMREYARKSLPINLTIEEQIYEEPSDINPPTWVDEPSSQTIELGDGIYQDVNATDPSEPITYSIIGPDVGSFSIDNESGVLTNSEFLSIGIYDINVTATDSASNSLTKQIFITVQDTTDPEWSPDPEDQYVEVGDTLDYNVNATDLSTITYMINYTTNFYINADTGVITSNSMPLGNYSILITATDEGNNSINDIIMIHFIDTTDPVWNPEPHDYPIPFGVDLNFTVNADDLSAITYAINDTTYFIINTDTGVITNISVLIEGNYPLLITATDEGGNVINASILIIVSSAEPYWYPLPGDQYVEVGELLSYDVNATDSDGITYSIDDEVNFDINSITGLITSEALSFGDYPLVINASDPYGNYIIASITIHFIDTTDPEWSPDPEDQYVEVGDTLDYTVNATDLSSITYTINYTTDFYINADTGVITSDTMSLGNYSLLITVTDEGGNFINATITIHFIDTTDPEWSPDPEDQYVEVGDTLNYTVIATDLSTITYTVNNTTIFTINPSSGLITNNSVLTEGDYPVLITATDEAGNFINASITIHYIYMGIPTKVENVTIRPMVTGDGIYLEWDANVELVDHYNIYCNGELIGRTESNETEYHYYNKDADIDPILGTYEVTAVNGLDMEGPKSDPVFVEFPVSPPALVDYFQDFFYVFSIVFGCGVALVVGFGFTGSVIAKRRRS